VDLVDEEHVARLERGQDRGDVLALEPGTGDRADADAELLAHDVREARLAETRRADEQYVVERLAASARSVERDAELLLDPLLADELVEPARAEALLDLLLVLADHVGIVGDAVRGAPDLILEVLSPATVRLDRVIKMDAYARHSVPEYWLADGNAKLIEIFRLDRHAQLYRLAGTCRPGDRATTPLVPGLSVEVGRLFG